MSAPLPLLFAGAPEACVEALAAARRGGPVEARLATDADALRTVFGDAAVAPRLSAVVVVPGAGPAPADLVALVPPSLPLLVVADAVPEGLAGTAAQAVTLDELAVGFDRSGGADSGRPAPTPAAPAPPAPPAGSGGGAGAPASDAPFAYDHLAVGVYRSAPDGRITHANAALAALLGYGTPAELVAAGARAALGYPWAALVEALRPGGAVRDFEARWARRSGAPLVTRENARAVRADDGRVLYVEGTIQEVPGPADTPTAPPGDGASAPAAAPPPPPPQAPASHPSAPAAPPMFNFLRRSEPAPDAPDTPAPDAPAPERRRPVPRGPEPMSPVSPLVAETTSRPALAPQAAPAPPPAVTAPPATAPPATAPPPTAQAGPPPVAPAAPPAAEPTVIVRAQPAPSADALAMPAMDRHAEDATVVDGDSGPAILVVEDNNDTRMLVERILRSTYDVTAVGDARSALMAMNQRRFDGLVLDINLGGRETGADVLRIARSLPDHDRVFAIALTAYALPGDRERLLEAGFNEYISKPFTRQSLMDALKAGVPAA